MTTIAVSPTYPIPNRPCSVTFARTESGSSRVRVWCTVAPEGSELANKLKAENLRRVEVYNGAGGDNEPWRLTPDLGGKYTFVCREYHLTSTYGGGYAGDPNGTAEETLDGSEATVYLYVGQKLKQQVGVGNDTANLVCYVFNDSIRETLLSVHGEATPAIVADTPTPAAKTAMEASAVATAVDALKDASASAVVGTLSTIVSEMVTKINAHNGSGATVHNAADAANVIPVEYAAAPTPQTLKDFVNATLPLLRRHRLNDTGGAGSTVPGPGSAAYHQLTGVHKADQLNQPLYQGVGSLAEAYGALADIWRCHEAHRVSTAVHGAADSTNALTPLPLVLAVHKEFLAVLANISPTAPPAAQSGAVIMMQKAGFVEA